MRFDDHECALGWRTRRRLGTNRIRRFNGLCRLSQRWDNALCRFNEATVEPFVGLAVTGAWNAVRDYFLTEAGR